jgi:hypothetical protein
MAKTKEEIYAYNHQHLQTLHGRLVKTKINASGSAKKRGQEFNLTTEDMWTLWNRQNGLCAFTGWPMGTFTKTRTLLSLDRIDNSKGYTMDNCMLVCWCANKARSDMGRDEFVKMCKDIANHEHYWTKQ